MTSECQGMSKSGDVCRRPIRGRVTLGAGLMSGAIGRSQARAASQIPATPAAELALDLIERLKRPSEIPRVNRVFANRNLRMDRVQVVGFDMDYTLALYNQAKMEEISIA